MTNPRRAEDTARGRYYTHPTTGASLVSVTNVIGTCVAKPALVPWAAKLAATWAVENWPALTARLRTDRDGVLYDIKSQVSVTRDKAADLGSRIHAQAEAHVTGQALEEDPEAAPYVAQYEKFLADFGVDLARDIHAAELTVAAPGPGYAGTLDLLLRLPLDGFVEGKARPCADGERALWLIDLKTSATRPATSIYDEYVLQLAALRHATEMWLPDDTTAPMPAVAGCAVLNLRKGSYAFIPVAADRPAFEAFRGALAVAKWAHARGDAERPVSPTGAVKAVRKRKTTPSTTTMKAEAA